MEVVSGAFCPSLRALDRRTGGDVAAVAVSAECEGIGNAVEMRLGDHATPYLNWLWSGT